MHGPESKSSFMKTIEEIKDSEQQADNILKDAKEQADDTLKKAKERVAKMRSEQEERATMIKNDLLKRGKDDIEKEVNLTLKKANQDAAVLKSKKLSDKDFSSLLDEIISL